MADPNQELAQTKFSPEEWKTAIHQMGSLRGMTNVQATTEAGAGTFCMRTDAGIRINFDPQQLAEGNGECDQEALEQISHSDVVTGLFMIGHEFGHAEDMIDPEDRFTPKRNEADHFFNMIIDDTAIDRGNRRIPLFDAHADSVYVQQIPHDLTTLPKHVQLLYAIRITQVESNPVFTMDPKVEAVIRSLQTHERGGQLFDILDAMTDPRPYTTLRQRRALADKFVRPHFEELKEEDKSDHEQNSDGDSSEAGEIFEKIYQEYEEAVHGHQHGKSEGKQDGEPNDQDGDQAGKSPGEGDAKEGLAKQIAEVMKEVTKEQKAQERAAQAKIRETIAGVGKDEKAERDEQLKAMAGAMAGELNLGEGDAESYLRSVDSQTEIIHQVAGIFLRLARPAETIMSSRYDRGSHTSGVRLHPRALAGVALQLETDQPQAVWQPVVRRAARQELTFGGLDIIFGCDLSTSMDGEPAICAANTQISLSEGLQLARYKVAQSANQHHYPDVRVQAIGFGAGTEDLYPLTHEPTGPEKGKTYVNLLNPTSGNTLVCGTLKKARDSARANPGRDTIVVLLSDGHFGDMDAAKILVSEMPESVYVVQLSVGDNTSTDFITPHHERVANPQVLPEKLYGVLEEYIRRIGF